MFRPIDFAGEYFFIYDKRLFIKKRRIPTKQKDKNQISFWFEFYDHSNNCNILNCLCLLYFISLYFIIINHLIDKYMLGFIDGHYMHVPVNFHHFPAECCKYTIRRERQLFTTQETTLSCAMKVMRAVLFGCLYATACVCVIKQLIDKKDQQNNKRDFDDTSHEKNKLILKAIRPRITVLRKTVEFLSFAECPSTQLH